MKILRNLKLWMKNVLIKSIIIYKLVASIKSKPEFMIENHNIPPLIKKLYPKLTNWDY